MRWETLNQLSERTSIPKQTIYNWRLRGDGPPAYKVHGKLLFNPDETDAWIEQHADVPSDAA